MLLGPVEVVVADAIEESLVDRRIRNLSEETIEWHRRGLRRGLHGRMDRRLSELTASDLRTFRGRRDRMILLVFLDTGCRVSELCGMDVGDVSIPLVRVFGKGRERLLALSPPVQREMLRYLRVRGTMHPDGDRSCPVARGRGGCAATGWDGSWRLMRGGRGSRS